MTSSPHSRIRQSTTMHAAALLLTLAIGGGLVANSGAIIAAAQPSAAHLTDGAAWNGVVPTSPMLVSVHNAGDTPESARSAIEANPSMIEVDVSWADNQLVIAHDLKGYSGPQDVTTLDSGWTRTNGVGAVLIDVKSSEQPSLDDLVKFLERHQDRPIYLSTPDPVALAYLHERAPWTRPLLSLTTQAQIDAFLTGGPPFEGLTGVSAKASLLTKSNVDTISGQRLLILAYSVNDMPRVNTLASWGVGGITTDSLSVVRALAGHDPMLAV